MNNQGQWIEEIIERERGLHQAFFGKEFPLGDLNVVLLRFGQKRFEVWKEMQLEPHFLPAVVFKDDTFFPGWKIKPQWEYWDYLEKGWVWKIDKGNFVLVKQARLPGKVFLVDTRAIPKITNWEEAPRWENDNFCGDVLADLRQRKIIFKRADCDINSRFGISSFNWGRHVRRAIAKHVGLRAAKVRLESVIQFNVLSQMLTDRPRGKENQSGQYNTYVYFDELFVDPKHHRRMFGAGSEHNPLAFVGGGALDRHEQNSVRSFRPIVELS
jgi:hypothetical protein